MSRGRLNNGPNRSNTLELHPEATRQVSRGVLPVEFCLSSRKNVFHVLMLTWTHAPSLELVKKAGYSLKYNERDGLEWAGVAEDCYIF